MSALNQLAELTTIVADTGDLSAIERLKPKEATTNPSLITAAFANPSDTTAQLLAQIQGKSEDDAIDYLTCALGAKISQIIEGRVSTEVDARLSFDTQQTIKKAHEFIERYEQLGVAKSRILIKIAATWEGIKAAEVLEKQGICCNLTLLFTDTQARACADAGVTLISPFVGRITDWQKKHENKDSIAITDDMGVNSVKHIYHYYKSYGYHTQVMGASFRSVEQILALAGCDLLTISPTLLDELSALDRAITPQLSAKNILPQPKQPAISEQSFFDSQHNHSLNELLIKGIDGFVTARQALAQHLVSLS